MRKPGGRAQPSSQPNPLNPLNPRNPRNLACISHRRIVQARDEKGLEKRNEVPVEETPQVEADKKRQRVEDTSVQAAEDVLGFVKDAKMLVQRMNDSGLLWMKNSDEHVLAVAKMIQKQSARPARA
tara:strand:- start:290 stop:667 length:378 start_codon:yes stop_codon:yes gene_type:complete